MQSWFHAVADYLSELLETGQELACRLEAEETEAVRWNAGRLRQAGSIAQRLLRVQLVQGGRQAIGAIQLGGSIAQDRYPLRLLHGELSERIAALPPDPHLAMPPGSERSEERGPDRLPPAAEVLPEIAAGIPGVELVGRWLAGRIAEGFATSHGMRRWYETSTFDLDVSLCRGESAVKVGYAGTNFDAETLRRRLARAALRAERLDAPRERLAPGRYRAWIAPAGWKLALGVLGGRGAFSRAALENGTSPFAALHREGHRLAPEVTLLENHRLGWSAPFGSEGYRRPAEQLLIDRGVARGLLVSARTGAEQGIPHTGADPGEAPVSLEAAPGDLAPGEIERAVADGIWLENLHYVNLSDRRRAGITGLSRFAAFRVTGGELGGPIETARFDDSVLELLGERLVSLSAERERVPETRSYGRRALGGALLPGAVVEGLRIVG